MSVGALMIGFVVSAATVSVGEPIEPLPPDTQAFCDAVVALESTLLIDNPDALDSAIALVFATAPDSAAADAAERLGFNVDQAPLGPDFTEAHTSLIDATVRTCNYPEVRIVAVDREYRELSDAAAGKTMFVFDNQSGEDHWLWIGHIPEDADVEQILRLPEDERNQYMVTQMIAGPTDTPKRGPYDLAPGRYVAACLMPEDADADMVAEILETGTIPEDAGPPHWETDDMLREFEVV